MSLALTIAAFVALGCVSAILLGVVLALLFKRKDKDEDAIEIMAAIIELQLHWPELASVVRKVGRLNIIGALRQAKIAWATYSGEKIWGLITKITVKNIPAVLHQTEHADGQSQRMQVAQTILKEIPGLLAADDTATMFDDAIFTDATGLALDAQAKANLVVIAIGIGDFGMEDTKAILMDFASDQPKASKALITAIAADLSTEAGRVNRAKKVLMKLIPHLLSDKDNAAWLRSQIPAA